MQSFEVAVIGAGHAGLAVSHELGARGVEHVVLERDRVASRWRTERWDSFTLLTPSWATWLPGWRYDGPDPDGFMDRDQVVSYFERYARSFDAPVREGVTVKSLESANGSGYRLGTSDGDLSAGSVVIATGPFQAPRLPAWADRLPADVVALHSSGYRSPSALPAGAVLVIGAGPSGQQIAEDLLRAGREVWLSVGRHRRVPRRYRGRDYYWWLELGGFYEKTTASVPASERRNAIAPALTGFGGGHDLDLRALHAQGARLLGRATGAGEGRVHLADDLTASLAAGDALYAKFTGWVEERLGRFAGLYDDAEERSSLSDPPAPPTELDLAAAGVSTVVWATGFRADFGWVDLPVLDADGRPVHDRGATDCPGVHFMGLPWLHRQRSPFIRGAEEDARHLADLIAAGR